MLDFSTNEFNPLIQTGGAASGLEVNARGPASERPALLVTRYCGLLPASLAAAVRDGLSVLGAYAAQQGLTAYSDPIVGIRNKWQAMVTLDIYLPIERPHKPPRTGEIRAGSTPNANAIASGGEGPLGEFLLSVDTLAEDGAWRFSEVSSNVQT